MNSPLDKNQNTAHWFSLGLSGLATVVGIIGIFAPRKLARAIGIREHPLLFRLFGLRQIVSGIGVLTSPRRSNWFWSRVGGGAVDLALLGAASMAPGTNRKRLSVATGAVAATAFADTLGAFASKPDKPVRAVKSITVNIPQEALHAALRDLENWPQFMTGVESADRIDENRFRFVMKTPSGKRVESIAEVTEDLPNRIKLRSFGTRDFAATIQIIPAIGDRGTVVSVQAEYWRGPGLPSKLLEKALEKRLETDLHRFVQWLQTGSVVSTKGQPSGRSRRGLTAYVEMIGR